MWLVAATLDIAGLGSEKGTFEEQISPLEARECSMEFGHVAGCLELQKYLLVKMWVPEGSLRLPSPGAAWPMWQLQLTICFYMAPGLRSLYIFKFF